MADQSPEPSTSGVTPYLLAMLLCDQAIVEAGTNKKTLVGIFDRVNVVGVGLTPGVYAKLTDAEGRYRFRIDYVHVPTDRMLGQAETPDLIEVRDRLESFELVVRFPAVVDQPGLYEFRLFANGAYVGRTTFSAQQAQVGG